ncbi:MAG: tetratricopeptide repeat protein [Myxococcota bacterium]|nr:tetratricopeptide repeat protein [Myxococcota bacterium]
MSQCTVFWKPGVLGGLILLALASGCSADHHEEKGRQALNRHDLSTAETHFRKAIDKEAEHSGALRGLGWTYLIAGDPSLAGTTFERCIQVAPENLDCLRGMASVSSSSGNQAQARTYLEQALKLAPADPDVLNSLTLLDLVQGEVDRAAAQAAALVRDYPSRGEFRLNLAEAYLRQEKAREALEVVDAGLEMGSLAIRYRAMLLQLRARTLVAITRARIDQHRCAETVPPVMAYLDEASLALDEAEATGVQLPDLATVRRVLLRRRTAVEDRCPQAEWIQKDAVPASE